MMRGSDKRLALLRSALASEGMDAFFVRDTSNIRWLTAFDGVFDSEAAHALCVDARRAVLHTDSRYVTACENAAADTSVEVSAERTTHAKFAAKLWAEVRDAAAERAAGAVVAADELATLDGGEGPRASFCLGVEDSIALAEFRKLEEAFLPGGDVSPSVDTLAPAALSAPTPTSVFAPSSPSSAFFPGSTRSCASLRETSGLVVGLRAVKDADEVRRMKAAQAITDAAFAHIVSFMRPGMTEREVQLELEGFMLRNGAEGLAFSSIVATGANGASPHAIPGDTRLEAGQCVVMDFGARAFGYCSDMTRVVFVGEPDAHLRAAYEVLRHANEAVAAKLRPGMTGAEAHELAESILTEGGFAGKMGHGLGHGVGIDIHEEPVLAPRNTQPLEAGNVVTVEPGIYIPGAFGMRLEDFGVITDAGFEVFTQSTHDMVVI